MISVIWQKNTRNNEWFDFLRLDLNAPYFTGRRGVFVIWYTGTGVGRIVKVGSGNIAEQLNLMRSNPLVLEFSRKGTLKVSWVSINGAIKESDILGVQAFLADTYNPVLGDRPGADPIQVNLIGR